MPYQPVPLHGDFGFGTMSLTWTPEPVPFEKAFATIKHALDTHNIKILNGGEFYGPDDINLKLIGQFWEKYGAEYPDLVVSIKGAIDVPKLAPDGSKASIDRSVTNVASYFPADKAKRPKLLFEIARVDPNVPYEETIGYIAEHVKSGVIDGISLSEVGSGSIEKAASVFPISCAEVEFSLMCQDILDNGVLETLSKHGIPVVAYSPLCRGYLTESTASDPELFRKSINRPGDMRGHFGKFAPANFDNNLKVVQKLQEFAHKKNTTLEALALSWNTSIGGLGSYNGINNVSKVISIPSGSTPEKIDKNLGAIQRLSEEDLAEIKAITDSNEVVGARYHEGHQDFA